MKTNEKLIKFGENLGYQFRDLKLLKQALTHRSVTLLHNERLEFLGDAVLDFVIAEMLFHTCAHAQEGELSRLRASLVRGQTLAQIAKEFDLGAYLILGSGELKSGGQQRESILADAMEAVIAAIYLDGGLEAAKSAIAQWFETRLSNLSELKLKDAKTRLQEHLQSQGLSLPLYQVISVTGEPHDQLFKVDCMVKSLQLITRGEAVSRRRAEQAAAEAMLVVLKHKEHK